MAYPHSLTGLSTREEITDAIIRASVGLDNNDKALFESAWAADPDITMSVGGMAMKGSEDINERCFNTVGPMDTQHLVSNIRIDVKEGGNTAHVTASAIAQHYRAGEGKVPNAEHLLAGGFYDIQAVKEASGQWKIKTWALNSVWSEGNREVMRRG